MPDIAHLLDSSQEYVRGVIHAFNDIGFQALDLTWLTITDSRLPHRADLRVLVSL